MNVLKNYKAVWIVAFTAAGLWSQVGFSPAPQNSPHVQRGLANIEEAQVESIDQIDIDLTMGKIEAAEHNQQIAEALQSENKLKEHLSKIKELSAKSESLKKSIERTKIEKDHLVSLLEKEAFSEEEVQEINISISSIEEDFNQASQELVELEEQIALEMDSVTSLFDSIEKDEAKEGLVDLENKLKEMQKSNSELEKELEVVGQSAQEKEASLIEIKLKNEELIKAENEIKRNLCEQQQKSADLEAQMSELLADKEVVTAKILSLASKKEDLLKDIDDLKEHVSPKKEKKEAPVATNDMTALLAAITNLTQQLQLSQQFQMPFQMQGAQSWNSWSNMGMFMMQQQQMAAPAWMNGIGGESTSGNPGYNPMGVNRQFIEQNTFQMKRPYGSELLDQGSQQPAFDFGMVRRSFQPDHSIQARDVSSVFFDFSQQ